MGEIQQSNPCPLCVSSLGRNHSANVPTQRFTGAGYAAGHGELRPQPGLRLQEGNKQRSLTTVQRRHYHFQNGGKTERRTVLLCSGFRLQSGVDQQKKDCSFFQCSGAGTDRCWHRPEQSFFGWSRSRNVGQLRLLLLKKKNQLLFKLFSQNQLTLRDLKFHTYLHVLILTFCKTF